ncbi:MAG: hypothetical protein M1840_001318 [Geoglossum simile]|nr:MAG: hypothetical protein M1840_001318 [Geoglossum simile]
MSQPRGRDRFLVPPTSGSPSHFSTPPEKGRQKRQATVYDAVAGRVSSYLPPNHRDRPSSTLPTVPPEEVLFRRRNGPTRYAESDLYFANEDLPATTRLPDSDLLKAIHTYASEFYARNGGSYDWRSMDETALLAMGVLLEDAAAVALGETGDLVFVEEENGGEGSAVLVEGDKVRSGETRKGRKRRRVEAGGADIV